MERQPEGNLRQYQRSLEVAHLPIQQYRSFTQLCASVSGFQELAMRTKSYLRFFSLLILFCLALVSPLSVLAQTDEKEKAQKEVEKQQALELKTLAMLEDLASEALRLKLPENQSLVLTATADLRWTQDEKRARNLFWDALNNLAPPVNPDGDEATAKEANTKG